MKSVASQRSATTLTPLLVFILFLITVDGCKKDSDPTSPDYSPTIPSVNGHWVGGGIHVITGRNYSSSMVADFVQAYAQVADSKFVGTMSTTWPDANQTNIMYCKGTVTTSRKIALVDTGGVAISQGKTFPVEPSIYSNRTSVVLSANGDTMSYSGPFGLGTETWVLVRQK